MARFNKVLLINLAYPSTKFTMPVIPVGIGYIAEFLKKNGIRYFIFDMTLGHNGAELRKRIRKERPDIIGISMMSFMYNRHYSLISSLKRDFPDIPILVGGPHISTMKSKALEECPAIDYGIMQEGEVPALSLCLGDELSRIPSLIYRDSGKIIVNSVLPNQEAGLDMLPFPRYEGFELGKYGYGICIVSSRGCPYACIYCMASVTRRKFRARGAVHIADEIEHWYKRGYREFDMQEDNPTFNRVRIFELCDEIERRGLKDLVIMCGNGVRADKVDREILKRMKEVGFKRLGFGVEAGNNKVLESIKKGETIEVISKAVQEACELGFFVSIFFIVGSPTETPDDFQDSVNIALSYPISHVNFFNLIPLPSTELYDWVKDNGYFLVEPEVYLNAGSSVQMSCNPVFETPYFNKRERIKALKKGKSIERFVKRRTIAKTFHKIRPFNHLVAWLYMMPVVQEIENQMLRSLLYRRIMDKIRNKVRMLFYK
ncbi:MAG: radical SAM protein [Candidatus Omnitrophota bacterium]